jgi:osmoprotectant transport system permease protein
MSALHDALNFLNDPANWRGSDGIAYRTGEHLLLSATAVLAGCAVALPLGLWLGHTGRGGSTTVVVSNASRALPTLALLTALATFPALGFGNVPTIIALAVFAIPPLLTNTYVGMRSVDPEIRDAARGMGLSAGQMLRRVEFPLAVPLIAAGLRTAAVQVVATATLAALVGGGGLGVIIVIALAQQNTGQLLAGGFLVALLALLVEGAGALGQRAATPKALRRAPRRRRSAPAVADRV